MHCSNCRFWLTHRVTDYEDGTRIFNFKAPEGKGRCESLMMETAPDFGCTKFQEGHEHVEIMGKKPGSPWHHSHYITCPDCNGTGVVNDGTCGRCCRTGRCLLYDDGYLGEEKTRRHPSEANIGPPPVPTCPGCSRNIELSWVACPFCGYKMERPEDPMRVSEFL
jgi:hypothetical protein